jgi:hypothetical protein
MAVFPTILDVTASNGITSPKKGEFLAADGGN